MTHISRRPASPIRRRLDVLAVPALFGAFAAALCGAVHLAVGEPAIDLLVTALALLPAAPMLAPVGQR